MATLKDISEITGFSVTTVSRALKDGEEVKEDTKAKVREVAQQLGYSVNLQGLGLRTGINYTISMIMPLLREDELDRDVGNISLISGVAAGLENTPYKLNIIPFSAGKSPLIPVKRVVEGNLAGGIIFNLTTVNDDRIEYLTEKNFPFVAFGRSNFNFEYSYIDTDEESIGYMAVEYLAKNGCKNILCINGDEIFTYAHYRKKGMLKACKEHNIDIEHNFKIIPDKSDAKIWREYFHNLMKLPNHPDGIFCSTEISALGCKSGIQDAGLRPNQDVYVICAEFSDLAAFYTPPLCGIKISNYKSGIHIAEAILKQVESKNTIKTQLLEKPYFIQR